MVSVQDTEMSKFFQKITASETEEIKLPSGELT